MTNITDLPPEVLFDIARIMSVRELHSLRYTCRTFYAITGDTSLWRRALSQILCIPMSYIMASVRTTSFNDLRHRAMRAEIMSEQWHITRRGPRRIRTYRWDRIQDIQLLPGGEYLVCLFFGGTLQIQRVESMTPVCSIPYALDTTNFTQSSTSVSPYGGFWVLFHCAERLYIYEATISPQPLLRLVTALSRFDLLGVRAIRHTSAAGNILGLDAYYDGGDLVYLRTISPDTNNRHRQAAFLHGDSNCTLHILSAHVVLVCNRSRISVYRIRELKPMVSPSSLDIVDRETIWTAPFTISSPGTLSGSPAVWRDMENGHNGPITILGPGVLHIVQPSLDLSSYAMRTFRVDQILTSVPAVGVRYALAAQREQGRGLVFRTCTFPLVTKVSHDSGAALFQLLPDRILFGGFMVDFMKDMAAVVVRFDEWTGRICALLEEDGRERRVAVIDVL